MVLLVFFCVAVACRVPEERACKKEPSGGQEGMLLGCYVVMPALSSEVQELLALEVIF